MRRKWSRGRTRARFRQCTLATRPCRESTATPAMRPLARDLATCSMAATRRPARPPPHPPLRPLPLGPLAFCPTRRQPGPVSTPSPAIARITRSVSCTPGRQPAGRRRHPLCPPTPPRPASECSPPAQRLPVLLLRRWTSRRPPTASWLWSAAAAPCPPQASRLRSSARLPRPRCRTTDTLTHGRRRSNPARHPLPMARSSTTSSTA
mmetsp:Transcript_20078/g.76992  ORF Transcript_20078/g.76992 Transcript_20078/m.76992 type:complete len:207 (+) Transcript_20078:74-694(+)